MSISQLFIIAAIAFLVGQLKWGRSLALLGVSTFIIYWLQPPQQQITFTFWLPTATLILTVFAWLLTSTPASRGWKQNLPAIVVLLGVILFMDLNRMMRLEQVFIAATPRPQWIGMLIIALVVLAVLIARIREFPPLLFLLAAMVLILLFVFVKMP